MRTNIRRIAVQPIVRRVLVHPNAEDGASATLTPGIVEIDILQDRAPCTLSKKHHIFLPCGVNMSLALAVEKPLKTSPPPSEVNCDSHILAKKSFGIV
jgi:hypothetical protein